MPRPIYKGAISFGLVTVPVRVYLATEDKGLSFNQLHEKDMGRIKYKRYCAVDEKEVPYDEIVRGYEYEKDHYVVLTDEELDRGIPDAKTIDILKFVPNDDIDPIYFQRTYYIAPEKSGVKAYALLRKALKDDGRVAIAKMAFRDKEHLATLRVMDKVFVLETMFWPDEIREADFPEIEADVDIRPQELKMAKSLIENMTGEFDPDEFHDEYREKLEALVERKISGEEVAVAEAPTPAKVVDLMDALRKSLEETEKPAGKKKAAPARKKKAAAGG
jgi:DNA end-binding protein Ku